MRLIEVLLFGSLMFLIMVGSGQAASVEIDGWNFTADLGDQWHSNPHATENADTTGWTSRNMDYMDKHNMNSDDPAYINWKGVVLSNAFWLPQENANVNPQDLPSVLDPKQTDLLACVSIMVHKVPEEVRDWKAHDILMDFYGSTGKSSVKDIEFNGRPALLVENDYDKDQVNDQGEVNIPANSGGSIDVLITDDTVVSMDVMTLPESHLRAWDVIEKFTISPK